LVVALAMVIAAAPSTSAAGDLFIRFPQLDEQTEFVNSWGMARPDERTHQGADLMGTKLAPVVAVLDGVIETMNRTPRAGYHITATA
jgi:murein DD-endopeptidase MepM/ murein hydrolase activator NlpD